MYLTEKDIAEAMLRAWEMKRAPVARTEAYTAQWLAIAKAQVALPDVPDMDMPVPAWLAVAEVA